MINVSVKIKYLSENAVTPEYATDGSVGMDLAAAIDSPLLIKSGERALVPTGIALQIPEGYGGFIFARSGLAIKKGISLCNGVGVIDTDYTGEIKVAMQNSSAQDYIINPGDRIAQLVFMSVQRANLVKVEKLDETERGSNGFGSTGK